MSVARLVVSAAALLAAVLSSAGCEPERGGGAVVVDIRDDEFAIVAVPACADDRVRVAGVSEGGGAGGAVLHGEERPLDEPRAYRFEVSPDNVAQGRLTSDLPVTTTRAYAAEVGSLESMGRWTLSTNLWTLGFEWSQLVEDGPGEYWVRSDGTGDVTVSRIADGGANAEQEALTWCAGVETVSP